MSQDVVGSLTRIPRTLRPIASTSKCHLASRIRPETTESDNQPGRMLANTGSKPSASCDGKATCETMMKNVQNKQTAPAMNRRDSIVAAAALLAGSAATAASETPRLASKGNDPTTVAIIGSAAMPDWFETIPGERMKVRIGSGDTRGALSVLESVVAPKAATPLHYHAADEIFLIMSGRLRLVCGGKVQDLDAGSSAVVPGGAHHGFVNLSGQPVKMLAIFSPGGMEGLFTQLRGTPPEHWSDLARRFDTVIVGPPVTG
jgi:quercetin dioxygenase-like cupin family protein